MQVKFIAKRVLMFLVLGLMSIGTYSQNITLKGRLTDKTDKAPIQGATVKLVLQKDSTQSKLLVTDSKGNFQFDELNTNTYIIKISNSRYEKMEQKITLLASNKEPIAFSLLKVATDLEGVTVVAKAPPVKQKGDTSEFSASQFKVNPDATVEDLIKKLPGVTVARDGTVTAMGEQIKKVTVDGKDFFGDDAAAALKNLPAEVVDKIQVFDRLSDQAQLTGFDDGNSVKTVNIVTKNGIKNGQFGRIYAGAGTDGRYTSGGNISFFKGNRRISLVGNFNNVNQQNFSSQDLLGVTSSGPSGGRGGGVGGGGTNNFSVAQASGISKTNAAGINFSNVYGKKITLSGSYFYNGSTNTNEGLYNAKTEASPKNFFSVNKSNSFSNNVNHRLNMRIEYKLDSFNSIFIIPSISFQRNNAASNSTSQNFYAENDSTGTSLSSSTSGRNGYNIRNNIMFRHSFAKKSRSLSVGFNTGWSKNDGEAITNATNKFFKSGVVTESFINRFNDNSTDGTTVGANIAYTEPLSKKAQLQIDYTPAVQKNKANQQTFNYDGQKYTMFDTARSNLFNNTITTNNAGINYRLGKSRDEQLSFGLNFQHSKLQSERIFPKASRVNQSFANILPNVMWRKKISTYGNIRVFYRASTSFPSITQLQDVVNNNNPLRVSSGNPDLEQSYTHFVTGRYSYTNTKTSKSFFANLLLQTANDYISNGIYVASADSVLQRNDTLKAGAQLTKPINLDGYKSLRTFFTYSMPIKFIKSTINVNAGFGYTKVPGLVKLINTITNSYDYNAGLVLGSNISEYVDFNLSYNANFSNSKTNTVASANKSIYQSAGAQLNLLSKKGWFLQNDISGNINSGLSAGFNQRFWLWNAAAGKKIFKKHTGELKLSVFDLLKQNQSITRTINGPIITDAQTKVLTQYFMLTFTYKLKNFGTGPVRQNNFNRGGERGDRPMMPGGGFGGGRGDGF
jgi:Outer membrane protein beta-barrel family/CarboxypepD_reg-like domain